jgi:hypothetical protein
MLLRIARRNRFSRALDLGPAAAIVLVWAFLWAWALAGVVAPLSRLPGLDGRGRAPVEERA